MNTTIKTLLYSLSVLLLAVVIPAYAQDQDPFRSGVRPTDPLSPQDAQKTFKLPPGFEIQLFAAEPQIAKPLNMAFDARGRLWISNTLEYPYPAPSDRKARDTIKVLEDTTGDGHADKITTFADGLNIPIGLYPYKNGVIAYSIPDILFLEDTDNDGKADKRTKLYGPFDFSRDTHGMNNSFRRGFDGWLYSNHGFNNDTTVKGADGHTIHMQSGNTYRFRLDGSRIEHFTWGQVNPFGSTFDELGNLFTADCHSKPIYQLLRGGHYPSFGKPHDGLGFVQPMMDHLHGSTAIAGVAQFTGNNFPEEFRGNVFSGNVMTSRVNRNSLIYNGSTILAKEEADFVSTTDPWFRPVDIQLGPDGALYIADFYNRIIGHYEVPLDHPGRDRNSGRIWRVTYTDMKARIPGPPTDLVKYSLSRLIKVLGEENLTLRTLAASQIVDHFGIEAAEPVRKALTTSGNPRMRAHALWILYRLNVLQEEDLVSAANDADHLVRIHAMKVLSETPDWTKNTIQLICSRLNDSAPFVQRAAADALGQHPQHDTVQLLLKTMHQIPEKDNHLRHTIRMAIRNQLRNSENFNRLTKTKLTENDVTEIASIALALKTEQAGLFLLDYIQNNEIPIGQLNNLLQHAARYAPADRTDAIARLARKKFPDDLDLQLSLLTSIHTGLSQRGKPAGATITQWGEELSTRLLDSLQDDALAWSNTPISGMRFDDNPWDFQNRPSADGKQKNRLLSSHPRGERFTGILKSRTFEIPSRLSFYLSGHDGLPSKPPAGLNFVRLREVKTHTLLAEASPPRNDTAQKIEWDLTQHAGKQGYLEIVDGYEDGAFAWLAVGRFEPPVVPFPKTLSPQKVSERQKAVALIAATLQLKTIQPQLAELLASKMTDPAAREALARSLVTFEPNDRLSALVPVVGDPSLTPDLRLRVSRAFVQRNSKTLDKLLAEVLSTVPQRLQVELGNNLARNKNGAAALFKLVESGHAPARLLLNPNIRAALNVHKVKDTEQRIKQLTADLASLSAEIQKLITTRRLAFPREVTSLETGRKVFEKNCAACHQVDGKGPLIGPQLDGIGNRGLERLVEDLLDPNRNVDAAFRVSTIVTDGGKVYTGLFRREEGATLIFVDNKGKEFSIPKAEVDEQRKSALSLMPANVAEVIKKDDFNHLVAFLLSKRAAPKKDEKSKSAQ